MLDRDSLRARKNLINVGRASRDETQESHRSDETREIHFSKASTDNCEGKKEAVRRKIESGIYIYKMFN